MTTTRKQTEFNKVVNFDQENNEITVLDYIFEDGDFKGATGTTFEVISEERYNEIIDDYYQDPQAVSEYWNDAVGEPLTYNQIMEISNDKDEILRLCGGIDDSYSYLHDYLRKELNLSTEDAFIFTCTGGGRMFDKDYTGNINPDLSVLIRNVES